MRESKKQKKKGKLMMKNRKNSFCNKETADGDSYKRH